MTEKKSTPFGNTVRLYIDGGSHDEAMTMRLCGIPRGVVIDRNAMDSLLQRRRPGQNGLSTARKETDEPVFLSGVRNGKTDGGEITAVIYNRDVRSTDYSSVNRIPRPSHADYAAMMKYGRETDLRGGGHYSGRLTALLCVAGSICADFLKPKGIDIFAHIYEIHGVRDDISDPVHPDKTRIFPDFPVINAEAGERMLGEIRKAKENRDSVGGVIECAVTGMAPGFGEHMFASVEERISSALFAVPGVKAVEFGSGFDGCSRTGSENNDAFYTDGKTVFTRTNNAGGINGGMTNGMPLLFRVGFKPVPSIGIEQDSVDLDAMKNVKLTVEGRHDPCIVPRAVPVVEAAAALAVADLVLGEENKKADGLCSLRDEIDRIDEELVRLFDQRLSAAEAIGEIKKKNGLPVFDEARERAVIEKIRALAGNGREDLTEKLYKIIMECSKSVQQ